MYNNITTFIHNLFGTDEFVPLHAPLFIGNEKKYLAECIDTTFVSSVGKFVDRFEEQVASYTGSKRAVVCVSGTNALHMGMLLVGVERDDEVLTQALTFIATCNAISYIGAHPVFLDVDRDTLGLSPLAVKRWLSTHAEVRNGQCYNKKTGRRIKACVPMHTFGHPMRIDELSAVCNEYHIELVEDAAESIGSFYKGRHTGTFGRVGAISFNGPHRWAFVHDHIGYNYRMPNINAALGCAQMENLDRYVVNKRETAERYREFFSRIPDVEFVVEPANSRSNYWLNAVLLKDRRAQQSFLEYTNDHGVMTRPVWELMNRLEMFRGCETDGLENTVWLEERIVNIPSSVRL